MNDRNGTVSRSNNDTLQFHSFIDAIDDGNELATFYSRKSEILMGWTFLAFSLIGMYICIYFLLYFVNATVYKSLIDRL